MFERILVLIDGSEASGRAVNLCMETAASLGSHVYALHVMSPLPTVDLLADYIEGNIHFTRLTSRAQALLDDAKRVGEAAGVVVSTEYAFDRRPDTVVVSRACARGCDLVVMPSTLAAHAQGFVRDVAQQVLLDGETPVLVCP